jgi:hypothetical protein
MAAPVVEVARNELPPPWLARTSKRKHRVFARPGVRVSFTATNRNGGGWRFNGATDLPRGADSTADRISVVVDRDRVVAGTYSYRNASGEESTGWQLDGRGWVGSRLARLGPATPTALALLGYLVVLVLLFWGGVKSVWGVSWVWHHTAVAAYIFAAATLALALLLVHLAVKATPSDKGGGGFSRLFVGDDRRASTSKTQFMLWTLFVAFTLAYISGWVLKSAGPFVCSGARDHNCVDQNSWPKYLILLGVPAGAAVLSKGITAYKVENGSVQKTDSSTGATPGDLATNDRGQADIVDVQYLIFNVITLAFVAVGFFSNGVLGDVPDILLGLTSASAATYVANKSLQTNRPSVTGVVPSVIATGTTVEIRGQNLFPPGADADSNPIAVKLAGVRATDALQFHKANNLITVKAPLGMAVGDAMVSVITAANVETEGYPIKVIDFHIGGFGGEAKRNSQLEISLDGPPQNWSTAVVNFGDQRVPATRKAAGIDDVITMTVPSVLSEPTVEVVVTVDGRQTPPRTVQVS